MHITLTVFKNRMVLSANVRSGNGTLCYDLLEYLEFKPTRTNGSDMGCPYVSIKAEIPGEFHPRALREILGSLRTYGFEVNIEDRLE